MTELLGGLEDEMLIGMIHNELEQPAVDPKQFHLNLMPFLEKNTSLFTKVRSQQGPFSRETGVRVWVWVCGGGGHAT